MRRLMLLRHAKSDRPLGVADLDRPLNERGRRAAPRMGVYLAVENLRPDHVVVSPSRRTQETWDAVREAIDGPEAETVSAIYEAPHTELLKVIRSVPKGSACVLLIGHNPGLEDLTLRLVTHGSRSLRERLGSEFPTAALAVIDFEVDDWGEVGSVGGRIERFVAPRDLTDAAA